MMALDLVGTPLHRRSQLSCLGLKHSRTAGSVGAGHAWLVDTFVVAVLSLIVLPFTVQDHDG